MVNLIIYYFFNFVKFQVDSFRCGKIPPELTTKLILLQQAIESGVTSPEKSVQNLIQIMKTGSVDSSDLVNPLKEILVIHKISFKNGLGLYYAHFCKAFKSRVVS